jgi:integrase
MKKRTGYLYKRGDTFYVVFGVDGKKKYITTGETELRKAEAARERILAPYMARDEIKLAEDVHQHLEGATAKLAKMVDGQHPPLTVADAWRAFITHHNRPRCSENTFSQYKVEYTRFAQWIAKAHPDLVFMRDVADPQAGEYARDLEGAQVSASTFNQHINLLGLMWKTLKAESKASANPWETINRRKLNPLANRKRSLTQAQYDALLAAAESDPDIRDLFILLAWTGQRLVDAVTMCWGAVDFKQGVISLHPMKTRRTGKAVHIPLFPATIAMLNRRHDPAKPFKLDRQIFPELADLYARDGGATLTKRIGRILTKAGLKTTEEQPGLDRAVVLYGAHSFRHFFITQASAAGFPAAMIKSITGHATDAMLEHYQHIGVELAGELARRIGNTPAALPPVDPASALRDRIMALAESMTAENWKIQRDAILKEMAK